MVALSLFDQPASVVARQLIGMRLLVDGVGGIIVETEAYDEEDPASHSFAGPTLRNASMFGPSGRAYVYRSYGLHWCLNVVCEPEGQGAGVLIRALQPTSGLHVMQSRRGVEDVHRLASGPGRLTQALAVDRSHDGRSLGEAPFALETFSETVKIAVGVRIGISKGVDKLWRFGAAGSPFLSRGFGAPINSLPCAPSPLDPS